MKILKYVNRLEYGHVQKGSGFMSINHGNTKNTDIWPSALICNTLYVHKHFFFTYIEEGATVQYYHCSVDK